MKNIKQDNREIKEPVKSILNKTPSTGKTDWSDNNFIDFKTPQDAQKCSKLIKSLLSQQREDYEFTRKEIIDWLHEQNWKCEQLEKLLIQPKK
ncbi:MAG TPA: hypothetical protein PLX95_04025 [bacterium]|nr:hypothetical protein [bacterium]